MDSGAVSQAAKGIPVSGGVVMANLECFACKNLIAIRSQTSVKRTDGTYETATAFGCSKRNAPLPTISKYDRDGCAYYEQGTRQERWREPNEEVWEYRCAK